MFLRKYFSVLMTAGLYILVRYPKILYYARHEKKIPYEKRYAFALKLYKKVSDRFHVDYHISGMEKIPATPSIIIANHQSYFDPLMAFKFPYPMVLVAKKEIHDMPFVGRVAEFIDTIFMDRDDIRHAVEIVKRADSVINSGRHVWIFPEGTRTKKEDHTMNEFKAGGLKVAYDTKVAIVPMAICGTWKVFSKSIKQKTYRVDIEIMDPISYEDYSQYSTIDLSDKLHQQIENRVNDLLKLQ